MIFRKTFNPSSGFPQVVLNSDSWNDFSYVTMFHLEIYNEDAVKINANFSVKIGFIDQTEETSTNETLDDEFITLNEKYFSLGQGRDYYEEITKNLSDDLAQKILTGLRDVVFNKAILEKFKNQHVFQTSLSRGGGSLSVIKGQYRRILTKQAFLTEFNFSYQKAQDEVSTEINLDFKVTPSSKPPTNIHILIGRNGVGKTTLLNNMINSIINTPQDSFGRFYENNPKKEISNDYFSSITSLAFSAFDPFTPLANRTDSKLGTCYYYVGLKNNNTDGTLKNRNELCEEFIESLKFCFSIMYKKQLWLDAINNLESDLNFGVMELPRLSELTGDELIIKSTDHFNRMSSGHAIILLSITKLVETVEEKTLVLIDEPESHLHPPLLSAFIRALSNLLINRNAIAIIATHSPIVLQEVPKSCVWKLRRTRLEWNSERPESETFGENVGVLTREVFKLEVRDSGFHTELKRSISEGKTYKNILSEYEGQIGFEGRAILKALLMGREL